VKYACIDAGRAEFPVRMMCRLLNVEPGGFYAWRRREPSRTTVENERLKVQIAQVHAESDGVYGSPKVRDELLDQGHHAGRHRIARLMRELGLYGVPKKRHKVTTDSQHGLLVADNLLAQDFTASAPNERWVADITYIRTREGWLYLAVVLDLYSRAIVGWSMSSRITRHLVLQALNTALMGREPQPDMLHHSDKGSQYASYDFRELLDEHGIVCSMIGTGNAYDNAAMESFFALLKRERVYRRPIYPTRQQARADIFDYIERFYNRKRRHGSAGRMSPMDFEQSTLNQPVH
jgi:putative transposase